ncbi:MAG: phospholipid scramblase-related protein [Myxococcota bacterium]|nr:phospholipid scramblase-related protein [Myxococcota bacterium]
MALREALETSSELFVRQRKEWTEIVIDLEMRNRYQVMDASGGTLGAIAEVATGFSAFLARSFLGSHRPLDVRVIERDGSELLRLTRAFFWVFSSLAVSRADGARLGSVERRFGILYRKYDLLDEYGRCFARVSAPRWRIWTFPVAGEDGISEAVISKKWGGALREIFTDADTYRVAFGSGSWSPGQRALVFAAAISIDFDFFENNQGRGGRLGFGD